MLANVVVMHKPPTTTYTFVNWPHHHGRARMEN